MTISGLSFLLQSNASNFGSMFIVLDPFDKRKAPGLHADDIMAKLLPEFRKQSERRDCQRAQFFADTWSGRRGRLQDHGRRPWRPWAGGLAEPDRRAHPQDCAANLDWLMFRQGFVPVRHGSTWTSTEPSQSRSEYRLKMSIRRFRCSWAHFTSTASINLVVTGKLLSRRRAGIADRIENLSLFQVRNKWGQMVPLGTLVNVNPVKSDRGGPIVVTRYNLYTSASITGNMLPGFSSGDAIATINEVAGESLPLSMKGEWTELMFVQIRARNETPLCTSLRWRLRAFFWHLRRSTRAGRCRWRSSWWYRCACFAR